MPFAYPKSATPALRDVSFLPEPGRLVATSARGSGKSSVLSLVLRFWEAPAGSLLMDGLDLWRFAPDAVRPHAGATAHVTALAGAPHVDERERDPIQALAHAYRRVLHEYTSLLRVAPDEATEDTRTRRADLARQLDELNGRLEALNRDES